MISLRSYDITHLGQVSADFALVWLDIRSWRGCLWPSVERKSGSIIDLYYLINTYVMCFGVYCENIRHQTYNWICVCLEYVLHLRWIERGHFLFLGQAHPDPRAAMGSIESILSASHKQFLRCDSAKKSTVTSPIYMVNVTQKFDRPAVSGKSVCNFPRFFFRSTHSNQFPTKVIISIARNAFNQIREKLKLGVRVSKLFESFDRIALVCIAIEYSPSIISY